MIAHVEKFRERNVHGGLQELAIVDPFDPDRSIAAAAYDDRREEWSVWDVHTRDDHRRKGLGSAIMIEILRRAKRHGAKSVWLRSEPGAVPFYQSLGFGIVEEGIVPLMEVKLCGE